MKAIGEIEYEIKQCVGCGYCCLTAPCFESVVEYELDRLDQKCPGLVWSDEEAMFRCELMLKPGEEGKSFRNKLAAGAGCSSSLFNQYRDGMLVKKGGEVGEAQ